MSKDLLFHGDCQPRASEQFRSFVEVLSKQNSVKKLNMGLLWDYVWGLDEMENQIICFVLERVSYFWGVSYQHCNPVGFKTLRLQLNSSQFCVLSQQICSWMSEVSVNCRFLRMKKWGLFRQKILWALICIFVVGYSTLDGWWYLLK